MHKTHSFIMAVICTGAFLAAMAGNAWAGFEWTPAPQRTVPVSPPAEDMAPVQAAPLPSGIQMLELEELESDPTPLMKVKKVLPPQRKPDVGTGQVRNSLGQQTSKGPRPKNFAINPYPAQTITDGNTQPSVKATPRQRQPLRQPPPQTFEEIMGFGSDMPLALALRQVVPAEFSFSFGQGVNPGYRVSWNGGRAWNEVVNDMIAPLNLRADVGGNTVFIEQASAPRRLAPGSTGLRRANITDPGEASGPPKVGGGKLEIPATNKPIPVSRQDLPPPTEFGQTTNQTRIWKAKQGQSLKAALDEWTGHANVELLWKSTHDYTLESNILINGTFGSAIKVLFAHGINPSKGPYHELEDNETNTGKILTVGDRSAGLF